MMKLQFKTQDFQTAAVNAVADLFAGQEHSLSTFSVMDGQYPDQTSFVQAELGFCNVLRISDEILTENMRTVQKRNLLPMEYCLTADNTPKEMPTSMAMPTLSSVSRMVLGQRCMMMFITGSL